MVLFLPFVPEQGQDTKLMHGIVIGTTITRNLTQLKNNTLKTTSRHSGFAIRRRNHRADEFGFIHSPKHMTIK